MDTALHVFSEYLDRKSLQIGVALIGVSTQPPIGGLQPKISREPENVARHKRKLLPLPAPASVIPASIFSTVPGKHWWLVPTECLSLST